MSRHALGGVCCHTHYLWTQVYTFRYMLGAPAGLTQQEGQQKYIFNYLHLLFRVQKLKRVLLL